MDTSRLTVERALEMAINKEKMTYNFYLEAVEIVDEPGIKGFLQELAQAEIGHRKLLEGFLERIDELDTTIMERAEEIGDVTDLGIGKYMVDAKLTAESTIVDAMTIAMKREEKAVELFTYLKSVVVDDKLVGLFETLRLEEVKHLRDLEAMYEDHFIE